MARTKQTPELELAAANAALRQEISAVEAAIPNYVPYAGPIPTSTAEFNALPKPWRDQLVREHDGLLKDLASRAVIAEDMAAMKKRDQRKAEILAGVPFKTIEDFGALSAKDRDSWAKKLTAEQMEALQGKVAREITNTL